MRFIKKSFSFLLILAMILALIPPVNASAAVKLNKTKATITVGKTVQLKLSGAKDVKWTTSDKKIVTVNKSGLVKGKKAGTATITATDTAKNKSYKCTVTVKKLKNFGYREKDFFLFGGGQFISYNGTLVEGAVYYLDDEEINVETTIEDGVTYINLLNVLDEGKHVLKVSKEGYEPFIWNFTYKAPEFNGVWAEELMLSEGCLYLLLNPELDGNAEVSLDGQVIEDASGSVNGDGFYVISLDISNLADGEHAVTVSGEGFKKSTKRFRTGKTILKRNKVNVENGFVFIFFSQYVENKKITVKIDNKKVAPVREFINGDGDITKSFDLSSLKKGKHTVTVSVKGFDDESVTFTK
ncbi:MAG: Ig-like domain-containing protein [Lachnospiraceae bacterium]|nr:Ig-like domain-containing protein [Lachnospiraceae bacterium]